MTKPTDEEALEQFFCLVKADEVLLQMSKLLKSLGYGDYAIRVEEIRISNAEKMTPLQTQAYIFASKISSS